MSLQQPGEGAERRASYRFDVSDQGASVYGPRIGSARLKDLSAGGACLLMSSALSPPTSDFQATLGLSPDRAIDVDLEPVHHTRINGVTALGARFRPLATDGQRKLSQFLVQLFLDRGSKDPARAPDDLVLEVQGKVFVSRLLHRRLLVEEKPLRLETGGGVSTSFRAVQWVRRDNEKRLVLSPVSRPAPPVATEGNHTFSFSNATSITRFRAPVVTQRDTDLEIALPARLQHTGFRDCPRLLPSDSRRIVIQFAHPRNEQLRIERQALEVSARGLSFKSDPHHDVLCPGDCLDLAIRLGEETLGAEAVLRRMSYCDDGTELLCGVELTRFYSPRDASAWAHLIFRYAHPGVRYTNQGCAPLAWDLLTGSGYVEEWTPPSRRNVLKRQFMKTWNDMPSKLGHLLLLQKGSRVVATVSGSLVYPTTLLVHHMGIDHEHRRHLVEFLDASRRLYAAMIYMTKHLANADFFLGYVEKHKSWTRLVYGQFAEQYQRPSDILFGPCQVYKCRAGIPPTALPQDTRIRECSASEREFLASYLQATRPAIECQALCYSAEEIGLERFARFCASKGHDRSRGLFLATRGTTPLAALCAEAGQDGGNLFGLLDRCWMLALGTDLTADIKLALLHHGAGFYKRRGKRDFVFLAEASDDLDYSAAGLSFVSEGMRWIARSSAFPAWLSYIHDQLDLRAT